MASTSLTAVAAAVIGAPRTGGDLVVAPTRDPIRGIGRRNFRAKLLSLKNKRFIRCESLLEMHAMQLFELVRGVAKYTEQPPPLRLKLGPQARTSQYTPDIHVEWTTGAPWLVEVKPQDIAQTAHWRAKFSQAAVAALRKGFHFVVLTETHIRAAGMNDVRRALDKRKARHVKSLGDGGIQPVTYDCSDGGEIEARVLAVLARVLNESPSRRISKEPGYPGAFAMLAGHRIGTPTRLCCDNGAEFVGQGLLRNGGGAS